MTLKEEFIQAVKDGKIEGLRWESKFGDQWLSTPFDNIWMGVNGDRELPSHDADHLCAHIRRWLTGGGWIFELTPVYLDVHPFAHVGPPPLSRDLKLVSELEAHQDAALWVLAQEGK